MLSDSDIQAAVTLGLEEDSPWGDATSEAFLRPGLRATLAVHYKQEGVVCGLPVAEAVFRAVDPAAAWEVCHPEGHPVPEGTVVAMVRGDAMALLRAERVALNYLQRLSGVASLTAAFVGAVRTASATCQVTDTRKTTPGLRRLEKYAVRCGGGVNHRYGLSDGVLVKDNHLAWLRHEGLSLKQAVQRARGLLPHLYRIELEVESVEQAREALDAGVDALLLDNMSLEAMGQVVELAQGRALLEASGNMRLDRVAAVAATGVDLISVGALTHSAPALDISLDWDA